MTAPKENNMLYRLFKTCSVVVAVMLSGLLSAAGRAPDSTGFDVFERQITETIAKVRTGATPETRADAAEHLADLTSGIDFLVDNKAFADLVSLLDTPEDRVRFWMAVTLGNLKRRAGTAFLNFKDCCPTQIASRET
jgi:hypothetical protein